MDPIVSIIVPVYNAEETLRRCIESVLNQGFTDFELLLVDDGSTDSSAGICREYENGDRRVRVIRKENTGVSDTRNLGLSEARGTFVQFLDSDDWITPQGVDQHIFRTVPVEPLIYVLVDPGNGQVGLAVHIKSPGLLELLVIKDRRILPAHPIKALKICHFLCGDILSGRPVPEKSQYTHCDQPQGRDHWHYFFHLRSLSFPMTRAVYGGFHGLVFF